MIRLAIVGTPFEGRSELQFQLRREGYESTALPDGSSLFRHLAAHRADVVVLDMNMPGDDGHAIARHLSKRDDIAVIMVSEFNRVDDRIEGLSNGADAFISKPVDQRELSATLASVTRRLKVRPANTMASSTWVLYSQKWELVAPNGQRTALTAYECTLLNLLFACAGAPVSRRDIVQAFGHDYRHYDPRRLEAIVSRLRRKIERLSDDPTPLQAAHGFGYAFTANVLIA